MKIPCIILAAVSAALIPMNLRANVDLDFDDGTAAPDEVTINAGDSFSFDVFLTSSAEETVGLTYFLQVGNTGSGLFTITGRDVTGTPYSELQTSNATFLSAANAILDPQNNSDAGGLQPDLIAQGMGAYFVAGFTIQTSALLTAGTYELSFVNAIYIDENFDPHGFDTLGAYTVNVLPEPSAALLAAAGLGLIILCRRARA